MSITPLPSLNRASPTFKADVNNFFGTQLPTFTGDLNVEIARLNTLGFGSFTATSTTSNAITTGTKTFTVETGKGFVPGQFLVVANTPSPMNYLVGQVVSYDSMTGTLVINVTATNGTGTFSQWAISVTSAPVEVVFPQFLFVNQGVI